MNRLLPFLLFVLVVAVAVPCAAEANRVDLLTLEPGSQELAEWKDQSFVPDSYFRADLLHLIDNGLNHTSQLRLPSDLRQPILVIVNTLEDGEGYPVTLSLGDDKGSWQNFLVGFDASGQLDLSLSRAVRHFDSSHGTTRGRVASSRGPGLLMRVISGTPYDAYLLDGEELVTELEVVTPRPVSPGKTASISPPASCCGPMMGHSYLKVKITAENNISANAWVNMDVDMNTAGGCQPQANGDYLCKADSYFRVDYPNKGTVFHRPDYARTAECWWQVSYDSFGNSQETCLLYPSQQLHATSTYNNNCVDEHSDPELQTHTWAGMVQMVNNPSNSGTATATSGCQEGGTWTVQRVVF